MTLRASFSRSESPTKSVTSIVEFLELALKAAMGSSLWNTSKPNRRNLSQDRSKIVNQWVQGGMTKSLVFESV